MLSPSESSGGADNDREPWSLEESPGALAGRLRRLIPRRTAVSRPLALPALAGETAADFICLLRLLSSQSGAYGQHELRPRIASRAYATTALGVGWLARRRAALVHAAQRA